jgi:hypothetical protein
MNSSLTMLTITLNCVVAGLCAGILFTLAICSLVLLLSVGDGARNPPPARVNTYTGYAIDMDVMPVINNNPATVRI